jgi:hypothetical protein
MEVCEGVVQHYEYQALTCTGMITCIWNELNGVSNRTCHPQVTVGLQWFNKTWAIASSSSSGASRRRFCDKNGSLKGVHVAIPISLVTYSIRFNMSSTVSIDWGSVVLAVILISNSDYLDFSFSKEGLKVVVFPSGLYLSADNPRVLVSFVWDFTNFLIKKLGYLRVVIRTSHRTTACQQCIIHPCLN